MIEITTSLALLLTALYGNPADKVQATTTISTVTPKIEIVEKIGYSKELTAKGPQSLETYLRQYFRDTPLLYEIAKCESTLMHFDKNGKVIRGRVNSDDVGVMQINEFYHLEQSKKLGFDIHSLEGNLGYAKWLYEKQGGAPWVHSSKCWSKFKSEHLAVK